MFHYYNDKVVFLSDAIYLLISLKFTLCVSPNYIHFYYQMKLYKDYLHALLLTSIFVLIISA